MTPSLGTGCFLRKKIEAVQAVYRNKNKSRGCSTWRGAAWFQKA